MRLVKIEKNELFHEIEIEKRFLFWKRNIKYRMVAGNVFRFIEPDEYIPAGVREHNNVKDLFYIKV